MYVSSTDGKSNTLNEREMELGWNPFKKDICSTTVVAAVDKVISEEEV